MIGMHCPLIVSTCISLMTVRLSTFPYIYELRWITSFVKRLFKSTAHFPIRLFLYILEMGFIFFFLNSHVGKIDDQRGVKMICAYKIMSLIF